MYSIGQFAKLINVTTQTLRNWDKENKLKPIILQSGHRRYTNQHLNLINGIKQSKRINVIYCRQSTKQQNESLKNQQQKIKQFCIINGIIIDKIISQFGSGLNYKRQGLLELLDLITKNKIQNLIIYYKDRLVRFGYQIFQQLSKKYNFKILIIDNSQTNKSKEKQFADDLISIIHYFSMKLYGSRNYKKKIKKAEENLIEIKEEINK